MSADSLEEWVTEAVPFCEWITSPWDGFGNEGFPQCKTADDVVAVADGRRLCHLHRLRYQRRQPVTQADHIIRWCYGDQCNRIGTWRITPFFAAVCTKHKNWALGLGDRDES